MLDDLGRSWIGFVNRQKTVAKPSFFGSGGGGVMPGFGWRYAGVRAALCRGSGGVMPGRGPGGVIMGVSLSRGLAISHLP